MIRRGDYGRPADPFFESLDDRLAPLARELRAVIRRAVPEASESIKWGMPVYEDDGMICAIRPARDHVALQFYGKGARLEDPEGLLEGTGRRMRHVKVRSPRDIHRRRFTSWIREAAREV